MSLLHIGGLQAFEVPDWILLCGCGIDGYGEKRTSQNITKVREISLM
jgi:hypothetical protein